MYNMQSIPTFHQFPICVSFNKDGGSFIMTSTAVLRVPYYLKCWDHLDCRMYIVTSCPCAAS